MHAAMHAMVEDMKAKTKNVHAAELGRLGGIARRKAMTKAQRSKIARNAATARWSRKRKGTK
jgi:hypothetical protein